jgi:hypothetical protein
MTNASGSGKNMTTAATAAVGCIGTVKNMKVHSNLPRCAIRISK